MYRLQQHTGNIPLSIVASMTLPRSMVELATMRVLTCVSAALRVAAPSLTGVEGIVRILDAMLDTTVRLSLQDAVRNRSEALVERVLGHTLAQYDDDLVREHVLDKALRTAAENGHLAAMRRIGACPHVGRVDVHRATQAAAHGGHLEVLQWLLREYASVPVSRTLLRAIQRSAMGGKQLQVLLWVHHMAGDEDASMLKRVGDVAALHGDLTTIKWLHELDAPSCFTEKAVDNAAAGGYLDIVEFLLSNRQDGYSIVAVHNAVLGGYHAMLDLLRPQGLTPDMITMKFVASAARLGNLDVFRLDREPFTREQPWEYPKAHSLPASKPAFLREAMRVACRHGHLHIVEWLATYRGFRCDEPHVREAVAQGHVHILQWVHEQRCGAWGRTKDELTDLRTPNLMTVAARCGQLEALQWLHRNRSEGCSRTALALAAMNGHVQVVKWLHENIKHARFDEGSIDEAALDGHLDVVKWLHENQSPRCTTEAMDGAAQRGHLRVVEWLHSNRSEGCTTRAMDDAARHGELEVMVWLHKNRSEGCTSMAAIAAARQGHRCVVDWLQRHYPGQFDEGRVADARAATVIAT